MQNVIFLFELSAIGFKSRLSLKLMIKRFFPLHLDRLLTDEFKVLNFFFTN